MKDYNLDWNEYFRLDETSPSGLVRIKDRYQNNLDGYPVGHKQFRKNGESMAWVLKFQGRLYLVHRIIWVLRNGSIDPNLVIDHLDGNPFNNSLNNLSLKTLINNTRNKRQLSNNTSGVTGVRLTKMNGDLWYYEANWRDINGKRNHKKFSIKKLGKETAMNLAIAYRKQQIQSLISEGADYTERHGIQ